MIQNVSSRGRKAKASKRSRDPNQGPIIEVRTQEIESTGPYPLIPVPVILNPPNQTVRPCPASRILREVVAIFKFLYRLLVGLVVEAAAFAQSGFCGAS